MVILETQANLVDMSLPAPQIAVTGLVARRCAAKMRLSEKSAMSLYATVKQDFLSLFPYAIGGHEQCRQWDAKATCQSNLVAFLLQWVSGVR